MSTASLPIDHAFVAREAGDAPMLARHRALHERVRAELGAGFDAELLRTLAPELKLSTEQATELWSRIVRHRNELAHRLGRRVAIAVAALDYLHQMVGALHHPVLVSESGRAAELRHTDSGVGAVTLRLPQWARSVTPVGLWRSFVRWRGSCFSPARGLGAPHDHDHARPR